MAVSSDAYAELHGRVYRYVENWAINVGANMKQQWVGGWAVLSVGLSRQPYEGVIELH